MAKTCSRCKKKLPFFGGTKWLDGTYVCDDCLVNVVREKAFSDKKRMMQRPNQFP